MGSNSDTVPRSRPGPKIPGRHRSGESAGATAASSLVAHGGGNSAGDLSGRGDIQGRHRAEGILAAGDVTHRIVLGGNGVAGRKLVPRHGDSTRPTHGRK